MAEHFYVGIYWPARREPLSQCTKRVGTALRELAKVDGRLSRWFRKGWTRAQALKHELSMDDASIAKLLLDGRNRRDDNNEVIEDLGFAAALWNGAGSGNEVSISFHCGSYSEWVGNNTVLKLPFDRIISNDIYSFIKMQQILLILVRCFDPDWGVVTSHRLREAVNIPVGKPTAGWLTYLSNRYGASAPNAGYEIERVGDRGELLIATREPFDSQRPEHVGPALEVAKRILASEKPHFERGRQG
jgi:hypothetical protein